MLCEQTVLLWFSFSHVFPWDVLTHNLVCCLFFLFFFLNDFFGISPYFECNMKNATLKDKQPVNFGLNLNFWSIKNIWFPINAILSKHLGKMWNFFNYFFMHKMFEKKKWIKALPLQVSLLPEVQGASASFDTRPIHSKPLLIAIMGRKFNFIFGVCVLVFCLLAVCIQINFLPKLLLLLLAKCVREQASLCTCLGFWFRWKIQWRNCTIHSVKKKMNQCKCTASQIYKLLDLIGCLED